MFDAGGNENNCNRKTQPTMFTIYQHHNMQCSAVQCSAVQCYRRDEINPYGRAEHDKVYHVFTLL
ncbi:hypothetical protein EAF00_000217 [Botryotinia globosa]|nr:hypothetical protein EAF00_000217 [Botryotinia globosa]